MTSVVVCRLDDVFRGVSSARRAGGEDDVIHIPQYRWERVRFREVSGDHLKRRTQLGRSSGRIASQHANVIASFVQQPGDQAPGTPCTSDNQDAVSSSLTHRDLGASAFRNTRIAVTGLDCNGDLRPRFTRCLVPLHAYTIQRRYGLHRFAGNDGVGSSSATKWRHGQISSDFPKSCQARKSKIFRFRSHPISNGGRSMRHSIIGTRNFLLSLPVSFERGIWMKVSFPVCRKKGARSFARSLLSVRRGDGGSRVSMSGSGSRAPQQRDREARYKQDRRAE